MTAKKTQNKRFPEEELVELSELLRKATPGPWKFDEQEVYIWGPKGEMVADTMTDGETPPPEGQVLLRIRGHGARLPQDANGKLVEVARNALPALINEIRRLRKELKTHTDRCMNCRRFRHEDGAFSWQGRCMLLNCPVTRSHAQCCPKWEGDAEGKER